MDCSKKKTPKPENVEFITLFELYKRKNAFISALDNKQS